MLLPELDDWLFCAAWQKLHACGGDFTQIGNLQRDERKEKGEVNRQLLLCRSFGCSQVSHREGGETSFLLSKWITYQNIYHFSLTNFPLNEDIDILYIELDFKIRFVKNYSPLPTIFLHSYQSDFHIIWHRSEILRPLEVYLQPNTCRIQWDAEVNRTVHLKSKIFIKLISYLGSLSKSLSAWFPLSYSLLANAKNTHTKMVCLNCGLKHDCFLSKAISENTAIQLFFNIICFSTDGHLVMPIMYERSPDGWDQHAALSNS